MEEYKISVRLYARKAVVPVVVFRGNSAKVDREG